ncbi:hypothetical protein MMYC01_208563 [Madurella mycetomatis]|uniref:Ipa protein n=1 Tax=Madurella mycetomatis TaxID=100816 RepID=A0A175VTE4_9PEZI|nr:hypothetical protein MMYC01_208563 [Madurella mycetomatis]
METPQKQAVLKELHGDLARKYRTHGAAIEKIWRSFDQNQRAQCMRAGAARGEVLRHSMDPSMGNVCKIIPEWNLRDVTDPKSDFFLDMLKHRATNSLFEQYMNGPNGSEGDHNVILSMIHTRGLRHVNPFKHCYTFFLSEDHYGNSVRIVKDHAETLASFATPINHGFCVPQSTGELILERQITLIQCLNIIIDDILDLGSRTRDQKALPKKSDTAGLTAFSKLVIQSPPAKPLLADLLATAREQQVSLDEYLALLSTEPVVLAHAVNIWFFSQPELVPDEKGRRLPVHTDRYISSAVFEALHSAVKAAATWGYLARLLDLLERSSGDKAYRPIILQEISNVCHLEYDRARALFKRHFQTGAGAKWFKRISGVHDNTGNARVSVKDTKAGVGSNAQLQSMLALCRPNATASKAADCLKSLVQRHETHPIEREELRGQEADALCDLAVVVGFIQDLSSAISMPSLSRKKGQMFVSRSQDLEAELNNIKGEVDLRDFVVPIDNLREPGMAEGALKVLDHFIVERTGTKLGFLTNKRKKKIEQEQDNGAGAGWIPFPESAQQPAETRIEQRRQKEKTRPSHSSAYEIAPPAEPAVPEKPAVPLQTFKVSPSTAQIFWTLFAKSESRGTVSWAAFQGAMADLGFSVMPKYGSVYTFLPPESMAVNKAFTVHRPHQSKIEEYLIPVFARRLKRVYGWSQKTFEIA